MISITSDKITLSDIASLEPKLFGWVAEDPELSRRIVIQSIYDFAVKEQSKEIEEVRRDESLVIPKDIDYLAKSLSLSFEESDKLMTTQPQTVSIKLLEI